MTGRSIRNSSGLHEGGIQYTDRPTGRETLIRKGSIDVSIGGVEENSETSL